MSLNRRVFLWAAAALPVTAGDEAVWNEYLAWLKGRVVGDLAGLDSFTEERSDWRVGQREDRSPAVNFLARKP